MDFLQLNYFMAVVEQGNFTKAAKSTFTSQSNISKQIFALEQDLQLCLFVRSSTGVSATLAGERLYKGMQELMPRWKHLLDELSSFANCGEGVVRLGFCESMDINRIAAHFFSDVQERSPNLQVRIESYQIEKLVEEILAGALDIGFLYSICEAESPWLKRVKLTRNNPVIYFSKKHCLYYKPDLCVEDFKNETFVCRKRNVKKQHYNPFEALPFVPEKVLETNSLSSILLYVESCVGVTVLGQSQNFLGKDSIASLEVPAQDHQMVGADAVWLEDNDNPALQCLLTELFKAFPEK